jgi:hypothetical protein
MSMSSKPRAPNMMRWIGGVAIAVCVSSALAVYVRNTGAASPGAPPPSTDASWRWAGASPGMNVYYAYRSRSDNGVVSVWVDRRLFSNPAGINKDLFDTWDVDCRQRRVRPEPGRDARAMPAMTPGSSWRSPPSGASGERVLRSVCADTDSREAP